MSDYEISDCGSTWLVCPMTRAAKEHLVERVPTDAMWFGDSLVVEPRYVLHLVDQLQDAGFRCWSDDD